MRVPPRLSRSALGAANGVVVAQPGFLNQDHVRNRVLEDVGLARVEAVGVGRVDCPKPVVLPPSVGEAGGGQKDRDLNGCQHLF